MDVGARAQGPRELPYKLQGVSRMMEAEAASVLWAQSIKKFRLKYTTFTKDGDSKPYNEVHVCDWAHCGLNCMELSSSTRDAAVWT